MKPGYKQTEVGVIPEEWEVVRLGDLIASTEYGSSAKSKPRGAVPVLRMGNLQDGRIDWTDLVYTDDPEEIRRYLLNAGDVLFNRTNTIDLVGKTSIYDGQERAIFAGYLIRVRPAETKLDARYLNYFMNTSPARRHSLKVLSVAVGQANINAAKLRSYPIPVPPSVAEQRAIAEALSDADALIESLEALIAKKRQIKQGAMQELLTGKRRLPGFSGEWETKAIGEICEALRGVTYQPADLLPGDSDGSIRLLRSNNVQASRITLDETHRVREARVSSEQLMKAGDILMCAANGSRDLVGKSARFDVEDGFRYTFGAFMAVIRPRRPVDADLMRFLLDSARFREQVHLALAGSSINNLSPRAIAEFVLELPAEDDERRAIAAVLSDLDSELEALEAKLHKARAIKQGMMQELLTGRTRLVPAEVS